MLYRANMFDRMGYCPGFLSSWDVLRGDWPFVSQWSIAIKSFKIVPSLCLFFLVHFYWLRQRNVRSLLISYPLLSMLGWAWCQRCVMRSITILCVSPRTNSINKLISIVSIKRWYLINPRKLRTVIGNEVITIRFLIVIGSSSSISLDQRLPLFKVNWFSMSVSILLESCLKGV